MTPFDKPKCEATQSHPKRSYSCMLSPSSALSFQWGKICKINAICHLTIPNASSFPARIYLPQLNLYSLLSRNKLKNQKLQSRKSLLGAWFLTWCGNTFRILLYLNPGTVQTWFKKQSLVRVRVPTTTHQRWGGMWGTNDPDRELVGLTVVLSDCKWKEG